MMKFELNTEETEKYNSWHNHGCDVQSKKFGGRISFIFTPTSLGMIIKAKCLCGETLNLTKSDEW